MEKNRLMNFGHMKKIESREIETTIQCETMPDLGALQATQTQLEEFKLKKCQQLIHDEDFLGAIYLMTQINDRSIYNRAK